MYNSSYPANRKFLSALDLIELNERDVYKELFGRDPEASFFDFFEQADGRMTAVANGVIEHYEDGSIFENIRITSAVAGTGSKIVVTLHADAHANGGTTSYVREQDVLELYNRAQYMVQSKSTTTNNAHTITLIPINATQIVTPASLAGTFAWVVSNAWADMTNQPEGLNSVPERFLNHTQIFKEAYVISGQTQASRQEIDVPTKDGGKMPYFILKGELDTTTRFRAKEHNALLFGKLSDSGLVDKDGDPVRTTRGLIPTVDQYGYAATFTGTVTIDTIFKPITKQLNKQRACDEYMLRPDHELNYALDRIVSAEMQHLGLRYDSMGGKEKAQLAGFSTFGIDSYTFHKSKLKLLSHDKLAGASGNYDNFAVAIPMGFKKDPKSQKTMPQFAIRYAGNGLVSRAYKVWGTGSNAETPTNEGDYKKINYRSEKALHVMGAADFFTIRKTA